MKVYTKKAQKPLYERGLRVTKKRESGKNVGSEYYKTDRTLPADEDDTILIQKGETYYEWTPFRSERHISKTYPKRSQLTGSGFLAELYDLQDETIANLSAETMEDLDNEKSDILSTIEDMKSQCEDSLSNMPEHLQESSSAGQTLQERIDALDEWYNEIDSVDCSSDLDEENWKSDWEEDNEREEDETDEQYDEREQEAWEEAVQEEVNEKIEEIQGCECNL